MDTEYISPVFGVIPPQTAASRDQPTHRTDILHLNVFLWPVILSFGLDSLLSVIEVVYYITLFVDYYY